MGVVLRATDRELGRDVAIKLLLEVEFGGGSLRERFLEEGRICSRLEHPNLVRLYDFGLPEDGPPYMVFEFIRGESLEARLRRKPLDGPEALRVLTDVGRGLAHAHDAGVVHRDLKPENVLLDEEGAAKVADFGLAKDPDAQVQTVQGMLVGTPPFMAPEYIRGKRPGPAGDQYALGILAYQLLVGVVPYDHEKATETLRMHVKAPVPDLRRVVKGVPEDLARWVQRTLAKDPTARFPHIRDFVQRLDGRREALAAALATHRPDPDRPPAVVRMPGGKLAADARDRGRAGGEARSGPLVVGALGLAILAAFVFWLRRPPGVEVRDLQVRAAPRSAEVTWRASGSTTLHLESPDGAPLSGPRPQAAGQASSALQDLEPGRSYAVSVRAAAGEVLQRVVFETPEAGEFPAPRLHFPPTGASPRIQVDARYPVRLEVTGEVQHGGTWKTLEIAKTPLSETHDLPLNGVEPSTPARLWADVLPAGGEEPVRFMLAENEALASVRIRDLVSPDQLEPASLGEMLDELYDQLQDRPPTPPDPGKLLVAGGASPELAPLLEHTGDLLRDEAVPLEVRLQLERVLRPLVGIDLTLVGFRHRAWLDLARHRRAVLPYSARTTLSGTSAPLGPPWLPPDEKRSRVLMTDQFLRDLAPSSEVRIGALHHVDDEEIELFEAEGRQVRVDLEVSRAVPPGAPVELWLTTRRFSARSWFELRIEDREPMVLWYPEERDGYQVAGDENQLSCHRLPPGLVRPGRLTLFFRIRTYPGQGASVVPVSLARVELRGS
jgi:serine/threonine-protein kinase